MRCKLLPSLWVGLNFLMEGKGLMEDPGLRHRALHTWLATDGCAVHFSELDALGIMKPTDKYCQSGVLQTSTAAYDGRFHWRALSRAQD